MMNKINAISIYDVFTAVGDFFTDIIGKLIAVFLFLASPFSIEKKDGKVVVSLAFKPIPKIGEWARSIWKIVSIRKNARGDFMIRISVKKLGYICIRPIPTTKSGAYVYVSPNGELYTATWYMGPDMEEAIATTYIRKALGHGYTLSMDELARICKIRNAVADMASTAEETRADLIGIEVK